MFQIIRIAQPIISEDEKEAVVRVLESGRFVQGENVENFEKDFAKYIGCKYAVAVSSGTAALHLSLLSLGIKSNQEVIAPSFSFVATANCALYCDAKPVFVDIDPRTFTIATSDIKQSIKENTKAVIPVHLYGHPADMDEMEEISTRSNLYVVEDCAQSIGSGFSGKKVGTFGDMGCFSFYPTKGMTTLEGGIVVTNNEELDEKLRILRNQGQKDRYTHVELGYNYRMNDVEATLGILQLKNIDKWNTQRIKNAKFLTENLQDVKGLIPPFVDPKVIHVFNIYTIRLTKEFPLTRDKFIDNMKKKEIETMVYYPTPIHKQALYVKLGYGNVFLPETEKASKEVLSLPVHPALSNSDLEEIVSAI